jgi:hypothetical protein
MKYRAILFVAVLMIGCKTTENLRTMRDIFYTVRSTLQEGMTADELDKVSMRYETMQGTASDAQLSSVLTVC